VRHSNRRTAVVETTVIASSGLNVSRSGFHRILFKLIERAAEALPHGAEHALEVGSLFSRRIDRAVA
jgi:hypothetical protein